MRRCSVLRLPYRKIGNLEGRGPATQAYSDGGARRRTRSAAPPPPLPPALQRDVDEGQPTLRCLLSVAIEHRREVPNGQGQGFDLTAVRHRAKWQPVEARPTSRFSAQVAVGRTSINRLA